MRLPGASDVWVLMAVLVATMFTAMWMDGAPPTCTMRAEVVRPLDLTRVLDREHLSRDLGEAARIGLRMSAAPAGAAGGVPVNAACQASLMQQIMTSHGVSAADLQRAQP